MRFAVIETGGKQYRVVEGDTITVEKLSGKEGEKVSLSPVLLLGDGDKVVVGQPHLKDVKVTAVIAVHGQGEKVLVQKFKRKVRYRRLIGHRQAYTKVRIEQIIG